MLKKVPLFMDSRSLITKPIIKLDDSRKQEIWNVLSTIFSNQIIDEIFKFDYFFEAKFYLDDIYYKVNQIISFEDKKRQYIAPVGGYDITFFEMNERNQIIKYNVFSSETKIWSVIPFKFEFFITCHAKSLKLWSKEGCFINCFTHPKLILKLIDVTNLMDHNIHLVSCSLNSIQLWTFKDNFMIPFFNFTSEIKIHSMIQVNTFLITICTYSHFVTIWDLVLLKKAKVLKYDFVTASLLKISETEFIIGFSNGSLILYNLLTDTEKKILKSFSHTKLTLYSANEIIIHQYFNDKKNELILFNFKTMRTIHQSNIDADNIVILPDGSILLSNKLWKPFDENTVETLQNKFIYSKLPNGQIVHADCQ